MSLKKFFGSFLLIGILSLFLFIGKGNAQMMGNYTNHTTPAPSQIEQQYQENLQNLVNSILSSQNVSSLQQLNCSKVPNDQFEKIGDAWMDVWIGNETMHQRMDNMLGGEGSQSLTNAHIQMGQNYVGCNKNGTYYNWMPMMIGSQKAATNGGGFSMMGWGGYGWAGMIGGNFGWGFGIVHGIIALVVVIDLILLGIFLLKKISNN